MTSGRSEALLAAVRRYEKSLSRARIKCASAVAVVSRDEIGRQDAFGGFPEDSAGSQPPLAPWPARPWPSAGVFGASLESVCSA